MLEGDIVEGKEQEEEDLRTRNDGSISAILL